MADSFVPVTFVADELLTSTKMNLLAANQAGFHDGTALGDGIIVTRHLGVGVVDSSKLANPSISIPSASSFAVTTANKALFTATDICYANVYLDFMTGASDTVVSVSGSERLYFSPQRGRGNSGVWMKPGDILQIKGATNYTAGWLRVDVTKF